MSKKISENNDADDEAFEQYLHAVGASIIEWIKQVEEVDS